jgi:hypothetical protein
VGVRETVMWWLLHDRTTASVSLLLPLVTRLAFMIADVLLGVVALALLRTAKAASKA